MKGGVVVEDRETGFVVAGVHRIQDCLQTHLLFALRDDTELGDAVE